MVYRMALQVRLAFFIGNEKDGFIKLTGAQPFATFQSVIEDQLSKTL